jgi:formylglycine-generating enzyme required for sulfatase activity
MTHLLRVMLVVTLVVTIGAGLWWLIFRDGSGTFLTFTATDTPSPTPTDIATWTRPMDGAVMVYVPAGEFLMGSNNEDIGAILAECSDCKWVWYSIEQPQHKAYLDGFWIDRTEVTNARYRKCVEAGACREPACWDESDYNASDQPVVCVSWYDAQDYAVWVGGRLPTEAEWEKAARGTGGSVYPWGDSPPDCYKTNYKGCAQKPLPVGSHPDGASPYGALDMAGNVWEWVADWYDSDYYSQSPPFRNPTGPEQDGLRVIRGGSLNSSQRLIRCANRDKADPNGRSTGFGFRVVVAPGPSP